MPDKWGERTCLQAQNKCCRRRIEPNLVPRLFSRKWWSQEQLHLPAREKNCWISWSMKPISKFFNRYITTAGNCNPRWRSLRLCFFDLSDYNSFQDTSLELFNYTTQHHNIWRKKWHAVSLCCQTCVVINNCLLSTLRQLKHVGLDDHKYLLSFDFTATDILQPIPDELVISVYMP